VWSSLNRPFHMPHGARLSKVSRPGETEGNPVFMRVCGVGPALLVVRVVHAACRFEDFDGVCESSAGRASGVVLGHSAVRPRFCLGLQRRTFCCERVMREAPGLRTSCYPIATRGSAQ
jgi:hypothetical protein